MKIKLRREKDSFLIGIRLKKTVFKKDEYKIKRLRLITFVIKKLFKVVVEEHIFFEFYKNDLKFNPCVLYSSFDSFVIQYGRKEKCAEKIDIELMNNLKEAIDIINCPKGSFYHLYDKCYYQVKRELGKFVLLK